MFGMIFTKRHPQVGARPGTLVLPDEAPEPRIHMINYVGADVQEAGVTVAAQLQEAFRPESITWIDVQGFGDGSWIRQIGDVFGLHPLLLEDIVNVPQRPKCEAYGDQMLLIVRMVVPNGSGETQLEQVSIVLGQNYVLTFQERYGDVLEPVRDRIRDGKGRLATHGPDYLAYAIVDTIIDAYYPALETIGDHIQGLEDQVIDHPTPELLGQLHHLKNRLVNLRRGLWPQREAVNSLVRDPHAQITDDVRLFLRDTYDHCVQTTEVTEMYREMVTGLMNTYLSAVANRTNEVMKVLTIVATIFIPLTFLAGIYGMNFDMPELHIRGAYQMVWIAMLVVAGGMLMYFHRKGWIGTAPRRRADKSADDVV